jgi:hypothetical protein
MSHLRRLKACRLRQVFFLCALIACSACVGGSPLDSRQDVADRVAQSAQLDSVRLRSGAFEVQGYRNYRQPAGATLTVYIEGDGLAWNAFGTAPSRDPTPRDPVALRLAALDTAANRLYLARPCQYQTSAALARCSYLYWTSHRFAEDVVAAYVDIIEAQKTRVGARHIRLIGYSGGGALAALIAGRLGGDIDLVTIVAPLDHAHWTRVMQISPMTGSLNPAASGAVLANIPQTHFISTRDAVVPESVTQSYVRALGPDRGRVRVVRVEDADHWCCWPELWPELLGQVAPRSP